MKCAIALALLFCVSAFGQFNPFDPFTAKRAAVGAWTDSILAADTTSDLNNGADFAQWVAVTLPAGTVNKLRIYVSATGFTSGDNCKMALYNASSNIVSGASGTVARTAAGAYYEITFAPVAISAGLYHLAWIASVNATLKERYKTGTGGAFYYGAQPYADFPTASLPAVFTPDPGYSFAVGAFVQ